jgi:thiol-disulfide isomerase/thioredoxin
MLEGKAFPITFSTDSTTHDSSRWQKPSLFYSDLYGLNVRSINLWKDEKIEAPVSYPTLFYGNGTYLVYPGERIHVTLDKNDDFDMVHAGNDQRNKELSFFRRFELEELRVEIDSKNRYFNANAIEREQLLLQNLNGIKSNKLQRLDSMLIKEGIHTDMANIIRQSYNARLLSEMIQFYIDRKDSLHKAGLYKSKLKTLLPYLNSINNISQFMYGYEHGMSEFITELLPFKLYKIADSSMFKACFDSATNYFTDIARDFILSKLMYSAIEKRGMIPVEYYNKYYSLCQTPQYSEVISELHNQQHRNDIKAKSDNAVLTLRGKKPMEMKALLNKYKGKLILLDFWASWCLPCIEEIPGLKKLRNEYLDKDLVIISISLDRDTQAWRKAVISNNLPHSTNFVFLNFLKSDFVTANKITTIPRYILIGKDGKLISEDAPNTSDPALKTIIDKNIVPDLK